MIKIYLSIALLFTTAWLHAQFKIAGKVLDAATNKPIEGVSVYLSNTTKGTITNNKGEFTLLNIKSEKFDIVASSLNYENYIVSIQPSNVISSLTILLQPITSNTLKEVVVEPYDPNGWETWGESFTSYFIGSPQLAKYCKLMNPEVLKFKFGSNSNKLRAFTNEKLIFENTSLGYRIYYLLSKFEIDFNSNTFSFKGYPLFEELKPINERQAKEWEQQRNETFKGSLRNFLRSLYFNQVEKEGFEIRSIKFVSDDEANRVKALYKQYQDKRALRTLSKDSAEYFTKVKSLGIDENRVLLDKLVSRDEIITNAIDSNLKRLFFKDFIQVLYLNKKITPEFAKTIPKYRSGELIRTDFLLKAGRPIFINSNGSFFDGYDLILDGYWAWSEKAATMLPSDFVPSK